MSTYTMESLEDSPRTEKCLIGKQEIELPSALIEDTDVFLEVLSQQTWQNELNDSQRKHLLKFLPSFPQNDVLEKQESLRKLLGGQNFKFGNPVSQFHEKLKDGAFSPDIAKYSSMCKQAKLRDYKYQQQIYYSKLLKEILLQRQKILEIVYKLPPDEPLKLNHIYNKVPQKEKTLEHKVKKKYFKVLKEVKDEVGATDTSSEEEDNTSSMKTKKHIKSSPPDSAPQDEPSGVLHTFAPKPSLQNGDAQPLPHPNRSHSPVDFSEEDFKDMMKRHRKRRAEQESFPDLDTSGLTLEDIIARTQPGKKMFKQGLSSKRKTSDKPVKKKKKLKLKEEVLASGNFTAGVLPSARCLTDEDSAMEEEEGDYSVDNGHLPKMAEKKVFGTYSCIFALLRDLISESPDCKNTTMRLEAQVREWQDTPEAKKATWYTSEPSWVDLVAPALKFLSGDILGLPLQNFIPFLHYKERAQRWQWIGQGRDSDEELKDVCIQWLENKEDLLTTEGDPRSSTPPPRSRTFFEVRPTTEEEKALFREQEKRRFATPHKAFTYKMHGYESTVGPVKGVYTKENSMNKAREHALLVKERPAFVTILTLVRDAAARLPNGEGTRADICELLKDSSFLAPGVTDSQINTVVSGALDRLHYEKDPCVKYDVNRKIWIYLHRSRTEEEFERVHQAQGAAAKAKKALQKPKPSKQKIKETIANPPPSVAMPAPPVVSSHITAPPPVVSQPLRTAASILEASRTSAELASAVASIEGLSAPEEQPSHRIMGPGSIQQGRISQVGPKGTTVTGISQLGGKVISQIPQGQGGKPMTVTFLQPQSPRSQSPRGGTVIGSSNVVGRSLASPQSVLAGNKPVAYSLIQSQSGTRVVEAASPTQKTVVMTTKPDGSQQKVVTIGGIQSGQIIRQVASPKGSQSPMVLSPAASPKPGTPPVILSSKPGSTTKIIQQGSSLLQGQLAGLAKAGTTIKIQGGKPGSFTTGKPLTIQRTVSMDPGDGSKTTHQVLQRALTVDGSKANQFIQRTQSLDGGDKPRSPATPTSAVQLALGRGGKPATIVISKPATPPVGGKPTILTTVAGQSQIISSSALGGKPMTIGGKPVIIGGKPAVLSGKPFSIGGKPIQVFAGGKPGQMFIQQGGVLSAVNVVSQTGTGTTVSTSAQGKHPQLTPTLVSQILQAGRQGGKPGTVGTPRIVTPGQAGIVVTQLPQGSVVKTGVTHSNQAKFVTASQAGLLGNQIFVQSTQSMSKMTASQALTSSGLRPTLISSHGGKPGQNLQVIKTMVSQPGGKPGQTTILLAQASSQSGNTIVTNTNQLSQAGLKTLQTGGKGKGPVFARIITPPAGIRLSAVRPGQGQAQQNVNLVQAVARLPTATTQIVTQGGQTFTVQGTPDKKPDAS